MAADYLNCRQRHCLNFDVRFGSKADIIASSATPLCYTRIIPILPVSLVLVIVPQCSQLRSTRWWSISRLPKRLALMYRSHLSRVPTRWSN